MLGCSSDQAMTTTGRLARRKSCRNSRKNIWLAFPGRSRSSTTQSGRFRPSSTTCLFKPSSASCAVYRTSTPGRNDFASGSNRSQASARAWHTNSAFPGLSSTRRILGASADGKPDVGCALVAGDLLIFPCWKKAPGIGERTPWPTSFLVTG